MGGSLNAAMHANYVFMLRQVAAVVPGGGTAEVGGWFLHDAAVDNPEYNIAVPCAEVGASASSLPDVERWFAGRGASFHLALRSDTDRDLLQEAAARGYYECSRSPAMLLHPLPATLPAGVDLEVHRVTSMRLLDLYERVEPSPGPPLARRVMRIPACSLWVGLVRGEPVARAMAAVHAGLVGIANVYVREECRRRGFGAAMTAAAIEGGRREGAEAATLEASALGRSVYERMGFETRYELVVLGAPGPR